MEEKEIRIEDEVLLDALKKFIDWSGPYLVRILANINEYGSDPLIVGSGGLLKYKERYFVVTNAHVLKRCNDLKKEVNIPYTAKDTSYLKKETFKK